MKGPTFPMSSIMHFVNLNLPPDSLNMIHACKHKSSKNAGTDLHVSRYSNTAAWKTFEQEGLGTSTFSRMADRWKSGLRLGLETIDTVHVSDDIDPRVYMCVERTFTHRRVKPVARFM